MIIFYVVFASIDIDPVIVAVIAFGLNFAAYVSEMYRTGMKEWTEDKRKPALQWASQRLQLSFI
jgi:polar amino acid transport system substrate-binding protein